MKKAVAAAVAVALLGLLGWRIAAKLTDEGNVGRRGRGARTVAVAVAPVRRETIRDVAEFTGTLLPNTQFTVAPKVPGRLEKLHVNIGDAVEHGDLVAVLESEEYAQQVAQAKAELEVARANLAEVKSALDLAQREFDRTVALLERKVASRAEHEEAEARLSAARAKQQVALAQIRQREAAWRSAEVRLAYTRIEARWEAEGSSTRHVAERFVDEGAMLRANDPIVSIVDTGVVIAVMHVIERDFAQVEVGQPARVATDAYAGQWWTGKIIRRAPVLREESRQARVEIEIPNPDRKLAPGMFVRVRIEFAEHANAVVVPFSALARRNGVQGVFRVTEGEGGPTGVFTPVVVGVTTGDRVEVLSPALDGHVVTLGHHLLEDGGAITIPTEEKGGGRDGQGARGGRP